MSGADMSGAKMSGAEMSGAKMPGAETARRRVFQRRIGGAEMALPHISRLDKCSLEGVTKKNPQTTNLSITN